MGHNNYSKFFKNTESEEVIPVMEDQISIEEIGDNDPHVVSEELEQAVINAGGEVMRAEEPIVEVETSIGVVSECDKLNLREEANKNSKVLAILNRNTELVVSVEESTEDFYKVITSSGVEGYCMKKFITIK
jgi:uncharacterized protein YgiM (DUF1202 family)